MEPIFKELSPARRMGMFLFIFSGCYLFFNLLSGIFLYSSTGLTTEEEFIAALKAGDKYVILMSKMTQLVASIGSFIVPAHIFSLASSGNYKTFFGFDKIPSQKLFFGACLTMIFAMPLINAMAALNSHMKLPSFLSGLEKWMQEGEETSKIITDQFLKMDSISDLLLNIFIVAFIPALGEEMLFRGAMQKTIIAWSKNIHKGIWISAIFFSAFHFQFYGFLPRMIMGAMLGYMMVWGGSIWLPVAAHFTNNAVAVLLTYLIQREYIPKGSDEVGSLGGEIVYTLISLVMVSILMFWINKNKEQNINSEL